MIQRAVLSIRTLKRLFVRYTGKPAPFAIGNRKSKIANIVVPVVQRIEQGFPKAKMGFLLESPNDIRSVQLPVFEVFD
jgi:hypothetical protein